MDLGGHVHPTFTRRCSWDIDADPVSFCNQGWGRGSVRAPGPRWVLRLQTLFGGSACCSPHIFTPDDDAPAAEWPDEWTKSVLLTTPKNEDLTECIRCRTVALITHASKRLIKTVTLLEENRPRGRPTIENGPTLTTSWTGVVAHS